MWLMQRHLWCSWRISSSTFASFLNFSAGQDWSVGDSEGRFFDKLSKNFLQDKLSIKRAIIGAALALNNFRVSRRHTVPRHAAAIVVAALCRFWISLRRANSCRARIPRKKHWIVSADFCFVKNSRRWLKHFHCDEIVTCADFIVMNLRRCKWQRHWAWTFATIDSSIL